MTVELQLPTLPEEAHSFPLDSISKFSLPFFGRIATVWLEARTARLPVSRSYHGKESCGMEMGELQKGRLQRLVGGCCC